MSEKNTLRLQKGVQILCMVVLGAYFSFHGLNATIYHFKWPQYIELYFSAAIWLAAVARLVIKRLYKDRDLWKAVFFALLCVISFFASGYEFLLTLAGVALLLFHANASAVWKMAFWIQLITLVIGIVGVQSGIIEDLIYLPYGVVRHSFGINYPTDFAAHLVLLILLLWIVYKDVSNLEILILALATDIFVWRYCAAKCGAILLMTFSLLVLYEMLYKRFQSGRVMAALDKAYGWLSGLFMLYVTVLCLIATWIYDGTGILGWINVRLTNRIMAGQVVLLERGLSLFGQHVDMYGSGGTIGTQVGYSFVDCSYVLVGIRYGVLMLIAVNILYMLAVSHARKQNARRVVVALIIIAMQAMVEHHLMEDWFNVFLLTALFQDVTHDDETENIPVKKWKKHLYAWIGIMGGLFAAAVLLPHVFSLIRTFVRLYGISEWDNQLACTAVIFIVLCLVALAIVLFCSAVRQFLQHKRIWMGAASGLIAVATVFVSMYMWMSQLVLKSNVDYDKAMLSEKNILQTLSQQFDGKIYVSDVPALYKHYFDNISLTMFTPELLDGQKNIVLILPNYEENRVLLYEGFVYAQISDLHGIYTNSEEAIRILKDQGYEVTDFCNARNYYRTQDMVKYNPDIIVADDGKVLVRPWLALVDGPGCVFYKGMLNLQMDLTMYDYQDLQDEVVAVISLCSTNDQTWYEYEVRAENLSEDGALLLDENIDISNDIDRMRIQIVPRGETQVKVNEISYQKISNYGW